MNKIILSLAAFVAAGCVQNKPAEMVVAKSGATPNTFAEGDERGNGADVTQAIDSSAWFARSDRKIQICYTIAPQFGVSENRIEEAIKSGFAKWIGYIDAKGILRWSRDANGIQSPYVDEFPNQIALKKSCAGNEDVVFKFGMLDADVGKSMAGHKNPVALSVRTQYDPVEKWGAGFVWVASKGSLGTDPGQYGIGDGTKDYPNWSVPDSLEGLILHEIGHIFGNQHVAGTIMDADISHYLMGSPWTHLKSISLNTIDSEYQLIGWDMCNCGIDGTLGIDQDEFKPYVNGRVPPPVEHLDTTVENFKLLMNRNPVGKISARLSFVGGVQSLSVSDTAGTHDFPITEMSGLGNIFSGGPEVFKTVTVGGSRTFQAGRNSNKVTLTTKSGAKLSGRITNNMAGAYQRNGHKYLIRGLTNFIVENGSEERLLFASKPL